MSAAQNRFKLPIAITMGERPGIGPEIIAKAFRDAPGRDAGLLRRRRRTDDATSRAGNRAPHDVELPVALIESPAQALAAPPRCLPVLQVAAPSQPVAWGQVSAAAGKAAAECVVWAARAALRGEIAALVTAPLHKEALAAAGVQFPGHTELLQAEAAAWLGKRVADMPVRMMLANDELRTVLVSIHVSLRDAIAAVTFENVLQTLRITHEAVGRALGRAPRIGVAGLNPHAGEGRAVRPGGDRIHHSRRSRPRAAKALIASGPSRPTRCSCGPARAAAIPASSTWWSRCTTTRD